MRVGYGTIKKYYCALGFAFKSLGRFDEFVAFRTAQRLLRGSKRLLGARRTPKQPILPAQFLKFTGDIEYRLMGALALYGLLRIGEILNLQIGDVVCLSDSLLINVRASKTDVFRQGSTIAVGATETVNCPVALFRQWNMVAKQKGSLFGASRAAFVKYVKGQMASLGFDSGSYSGHSFRRGGATALLCAGVHSEIIMRKGRWKSEAFRDYLEIPSKVMAELSSEMVSQDWDPNWVMS